MKKNAYLYLLLFIVLTIISCSDDTCNLDTETLLTLEITVDDADLVAAQFKEGLSIYSPAWSDSIDVSEGLEFMLSPYDVTTTIVLTSTNSIFWDTLYIFHKNEPRFLSPECGFIFDFKIDSISNTWNLIDSVYIKKDEITNDEKGILEIFYK